MLLFLLVLLFLRDLVQLEAELAFAHALALPAPGACEELASVASVRRVHSDSQVARLLLVLVLVPTSFSGL